jgi:hypothetical protein
MAAESDPRPREERERALTARAERQHAVIGRDQIFDLDFSRHTLQRWLAGGRLVRVHPNVYSLGGGRLTQHGRWFAALLATRPNPALSHTSSLAKMGLAREGRFVHVTVTNRRPYDLDGVIVHRCRSIHPEDLTRIDGIPVTALARTLIDVAESEGAGFVAKVLEEADRRRLLDPAAIQACAERNPGRRGLAILLPLVEDYVSTPDAKEGLERKFQLFLRDRGLPIRRSTRSSTAISSTAGGPSSGWSSSSTAAPGTSTGTPASATSSATPPSSATTSARSGSRTAGSAGTGTTWKPT